MTDILEKKDIQNVQLPTIAKKQVQNNSSKSSTDREQQNGANVLPQTHKKKQKRHKIKPRKHSPQYYEEKRIKKLNRLRQKNWDSHFINDQIPDILNKKKLRTKRALTRAIQNRRSMTANQHKLATIQLSKQGIQTHNQDKKNRTTKSFKIRVVAKKYQQSAQQQKNNIKAQQGKIQTKKPIIKTQKLRPKRGSQINEQLSQQKQQYKKKIQQSLKQNKFLNCHKQLLQQFLGLIYNKGIRQMIDKQLLNILNKKSMINKIIETIQKRQGLLNKVKQTKLLDKSILQKQQNKAKQLYKAFFELIDDYRTSTLICIQEILKWKEYWQQTYNDVFNQTKSFDLIWKEQNYLLSIMKSTDNMLVQYYNQNKPSNSQTVIIKSKDPFLISLYSLEKEDKNIVLKIRACQLLLLQQQYNSLKK